MKRKNNWMSMGMVVCAALMATSVARAEEDGAIRQTIRAFVQAGDAQDADAASSALHAGFRTAFVVGAAPKTMLIDRPGYLGLLEAKKIGGDDREVKILSIERAGPLATARVRLEGAKGTFDGSMTLIREDGRWQIYQDAVHMEPKGG